jgi:hypothetical protein
MLNVSDQLFRPQPTVHLPRGTLDVCEDPVDRPEMLPVVRSLAEDRDPCVHHHLIPDFRVTFRVRSSGRPRLRINAGPRCKPKREVQEGAQNQARLWRRSIIGTEPPPCGDSALI